MMSNEVRNARRDAVERSAKSVDPAKVIVSMDFGRWTGTILFADGSQLIVANTLDGLQTFESDKDYEAYCG